MLLYFILNHTLLCIITEEYLFSICMLNLLSNQFSTNNFVTDHYVRSHITTCASSRYLPTINRLWYKEVL